MASLTPNRTAADLQVRVRQEPLLEVGYQYQMRIYHALGNLSMVRKVYNQALDVGRKMYGAESDDLRDLFQQLTA